MKLLYFSSLTTHTRYLFQAQEMDDEIKGEGNSVNYKYRMHDPRLGRFLSVDPKAHEREWVSLYNFVQNNPIIRVDPTGAIDNPIFDREGEFLGTDDKGLQGDAIVMKRDDFKQGMSHEDALSKKTHINSSGAQKKVDKFMSNVKKRPDYDGYLTLKEANKWYKEGNGKPLFTSLAKLDLSGIVSLGENYVGEKGTYNLLLNSNSLNDGLVYGNITLKRYSNNQVRAYADEYNFEIHNAWNPLNLPRNLETLIGREFAGEGQKFEINLYGSKTLTPILPWIK